MASQVCPVPRRLLIVASARPRRDEHHHVAQQEHADDSDVCGLIVKLAAPLAVVTFRAQRSRPGSVRACGDAPLSARDVPPQNEPPAAREMAQNDGHRLQNWRVNLCEPWPTLRRVRNAGGAQSPFAVRWSSYTGSRSPCRASEMMRCATEFAAVSLRSTRHSARRASSKTLASMLISSGLKEPASRRRRIGIGTTPTPTTAV
jgi:hypothetical protein